MLVTGMAPNQRSISGLEEGVSGRYMKDLNTGIIGNNSERVSPGSDSWHFHFYLHPLLCLCTRMVSNSLQNESHPWNITQHTSASFGVRMCQQGPWVEGPWVSYPTKRFTGG